MSIKKVVKKILKMDNQEIIYGKEDASNYPKALIDLVNHYKELEDDKIIMVREEKNKSYDPKIKKIINGYDLVNFEIEKYGDDKVKLYSSESLSSGDPIKYKPFPGSIKGILKTCLSSNLNAYPSTVGSSRARQDLVNYLVKEGFPKSRTDYCDGLNVHNVAFINSTTQAFVMIMKTIVREHDVIIMTAPNYGIFAELSEKMGIHIETIDLKEEDNFFINPEELSKKIDSINKKLKKKYEGVCDYIPKCVAYLNINPHNPIGNVMTKDNMDLITQIGDICLEKGVFIIDDLIYRDLTYDREKLAFPIGSIPKYFNNTISLFGLSKSYGLAGFRAGFIVMPTPIFWGIATAMFDLMDSMPVLQVEAVRGAFNASKSRYKEYKKYFDKLIPKYLYQLDLVTALIYGINEIKDEYTKNKIIRDVRNYNSDEKVVNQILKGIKGVKIREKTYPKSGFFIVGDFTELKGKYYKNKKIETESDLLKAMYNYGKVRYLMGENLAWPNNEFVARINFAIDKNVLIHNFYQINRLVEELKDEPIK